MDADRTVAAAQAAAQSDAETSDSLIAPELLGALGVDPAVWLAPLREACFDYDINTPNRIAYFLAQCLHETAGFTRLVESFNYSAGTLLATFPKYVTPGDAQRLYLEPRLVAERVYGSRMGNGPEGSGDGWDFRGRGLLQITGRAMYAKCHAATMIPCLAHPEALEEPEGAAMSAAWIFAVEKFCNPLADTAQFQSVTLRINGGLTGQESRLAWLVKVRKAMQ